jgi:hypothetical protein
MDVKTRSGFSRSDAEAGGFTFVRQGEGGPEPWLAAGHGQSFAGEDELECLSAVEYWIQHQERMGKPVGGVQA